MDSNLVESDDRIGTYTVHALLGTGKYSVVRSAFLTQDQHYGSSKSLFPDGRIRSPAHPAAEPTNRDSVNTKDAASLRLTNRVYPTMPPIATKQSLALGPTVAIKSIDKCRMPCIAGNANSF